MKKIIVSAVFFTGILAVPYAFNKPTQYQYTRLVWSDEFNGTGLPDSTKWDYDKGMGCPQLCGWGNNELQYYGVRRTENTRMENGVLIIEARKEVYEGAGYTSGRLVTRNRQSWKYGRMGVRARLPQGKGLWPAFWMMPEQSVYGNWPNSGEIDVMENVGYFPDSIFGTVHTKSYNHMIGTQKTKGITFKDVQKGFHIYEVEWSPEEIRLLFDGKVYNRIPNEKKTYAEWPFDQPFHIILNIAVGGNLGGRFGVDDSVFPQRMEVDWVRVYQ